MVGAPGLSQRIVVTGSTGIAAAVARDLSSAGHAVYIFGIDAESCRDLAEEIGQPTNWQAVDLRDETATRAAFDVAKESLGGLTGLVTVAGGSGRAVGDGDIAGISLTGWNETLALNLTTTFLSMSAALNLMQQGGSIVSVSSVLAMEPQPDMFRTHAYAAAKGAINSLVRSVAAAYVNQGIRVNAVAPGLVATPMSLRAQQDQGIQTFITGKQPLSGGFLSAEEVATVIVNVLMTPSMTGQVVTIDGGWSVVPS